MGPQARYVTNRERVYAPDLEAFVFDCGRDRRLTALRGPAGGPPDLMIRSSESIGSGFLEANYDAQDRARSEGRNSPSCMRSWPLTEDVNARSRKASRHADIGRSRGGTSRRPGRLGRLSDLPGDRLCGCPGNGLSRHSVHPPEQHAHPALPARQAGRPRGRRGRGCHIIGNGRDHIQPAHPARAGRPLPGGRLPLWRHPRFHHPRHRTTGPELHVRRRAASRDLGEGAAPDDQGVLRGDDLESSNARSAPEGGRGLRARAPADERDRQHVREPRQLPSPRRGIRSVLAQRDEVPQRTFGH